MTIFEDIEILIWESDEVYLTEVWGMVGGILLQLGLSIGIGAVTNEVTNRVNGVNQDYVKQLETETQKLAAQNQQMAEYISHKEALGFFGRLIEDLGVTKDVLLQYGIIGSIILGIVLFFSFKAKIFKNDYEIKSVIHLETELRKIAYSESLEIKNAFDSIINARNNYIKSTKQTAVIFNIYLNSFFEVFSLLILTRIKKTNTRYSDLSAFLSKNADINDCLNTFKLFYKDNRTFINLSNNLNLFFQPK